MQSPISQTQNQFAFLDVDSPIVAGYRNYSMIDKEGNLYMAGEDAIYKGPNGHETEVFFGEDTDTKISKIPAKIYTVSKVINISQMGNLIGVLTEDGIVRIWELKSDKVFGLSMPEKWTIILANIIGDDEN